MNKSESKYFHTAERMDEALLSLLLEKDFERITIKDVCARAGVNRSTFYLHYENTADLLAEAVELVNRRFSSGTPDRDAAAIAAAPREELYFITDRWLLPYLGFVRENRYIYKAIHSQMAVFGAERAYREFFRDIFSPVLSRFGVAEERHEYIMTFYRHGLVAVLMKWVEGGCAESVEEIADVIKLCVRGGSGEKDG